MSKDINNRYREEEKDEIIENEQENIEKDEKDSCSNDDQVKQLEDEIKKLKNEVLVAKANEINFKKRLEEDKLKSIKYANQGLLEKFVDQLDLFDSVVNMKTDDPMLKNFLMGFEMINNNFKQIINDEGVKRIEVKIGDQFDPRYHHPFETEWNEDYEENAILAELKGGYTYKDRVLRPTLVKVNKKEEVKNNE